MQAGLRVASQRTRRVPLFGGKVAVKPVYRPEIDGLRAVAVLAVMLFHAAPNLLPGGFLGVDIFFVISGYLITGILLALSGQAGTSFGQALKNFWIRRARRILPALVLCVAVTQAIGVLVMRPAELTVLAQSGLAALFSVSNIFFWRQPRSYFHDDLADNPLIHTWSLGVEEQFYLLYPLGVLFLARRQPKLLFPLLAIGIAMSFCAAQYFSSGRSAGAAFFLLPTRAWQLGAGALVWLWLAKGNDTHRDTLWGSRARSACTALALGGIVASVLFIDERDAIPGLGSLPATLGAMLFIAAGSSENGPGRYLAMRLPVAIGLISYSLYLWHQPLLAFSRFAFADFPQVDGAIAAVALLLAVTIGWASWRYVEQPMRDGRRPARAVLGILALAVLATSATTIALSVSAGWPQRLSPTQLSLADLAEREDVERKQRARCARFNDRWRTPIGECTIPANTPPTIAVIGDSHASALFERVGEIADQARTGATLLFAPGCPPVALAPELEVGKQRCAVFPAETVRWLDSRPAIRTVVVAYHWNTFVDAGLVFEPTPAQRAAFEAYLADLAGKDRRVVLMRPLPMAEIDGMRAAFAAERFGREEVVAVDLDVHRARVSGMERFIDALDVERLDTIDPVATLCDPVRRACPLTIDAQPVYRDRHHLTRHGASLVLPDTQARLIVPPGAEMWKRTDLGAIGDPNGTER